MRSFSSHLPKSIASGGNTRFETCLRSVRHSLNPRELSEPFMIFLTFCFIMASLFLAGSTVPGCDPSTYHQRAPIIRRRGRLRILPSAKLRDLQPVDFQEIVDLLLEKKPHDMAIDEPVFYLIFLSDDNFVCDIDC